MNFWQLVFLILVSLVIALQEIQIEGKGGWAEHLPTWKIKNPIRGIVGWPTLVDGYHLYLWLLMFLIFHAPFFFGFPFNKTNELLAIEMVLLFSILEDFLWFVFNPAWGIKKFFTEEIPWHPHKILFLPQNYWISFIIIGVFEIVKNIIT
jgi:hypothetical protein